MSVMLFRLAFSQPDERVQTPPINHMIRSLLVGGDRIIHVMVSVERRK